MWHTNTTRLHPSEKKILVTTSVFVLPSCSIGSQENNSHWPSPGHIDLTSGLTSPQEIRMFFNFHRGQERHSLGVLINTAYNGGAVTLLGNAPLKKEKQLAGSPCVFSIHFACRSHLSFAWNVSECPSTSSQEPHVFFPCDHSNQTISCMHSFWHNAANTDPVFTLLFLHLSYSLGDILNLHTSRLPFLLLIDFFLKNVIWVIFNLLLWCTCVCVHVCVKKQECIMICVCRGQRTVGSVLTIYICVGSGNRTQVARLA